MKYYSKILFCFFIGIYLLLGSCKKTDPFILEKGVSVQLAQLREKQLSYIHYDLTFQIPDSLSKPVLGYEVIRFHFSKEFEEPLILDFRNPSSFIHEVKINSKVFKLKFENEHLIIPSAKLNQGENQIEISFVAGDRALNRNQEYLYTLFVPDRACTAFPCFDQPSLKAKFKTQISVPNHWLAVSNAPLLNQEDEQRNRKTFIFDQSEAISTYLFSFVAGKFKSISNTYGEREITLYHREKDQKKIDQNIEDLFKLQHTSLEWIEDYTQIAYPFKKLDFILIPSFQYSGMEHPGAILYRDSKLFLETNATIREELDRANLIAHETAHMWFGDLVTMEWFSEVWLKEVFANFMAGKIVNPQFPQVNHQLNFLINHYPASYRVDRTKGANPIEQELDNMKNAGSLYGAIIYHKAPIMMKHLETKMGDHLLKEGLQEYLEGNKYGNASWDDLITILDSKTESNLEKWSRSWIYEPGMPNYAIKKAFNEFDRLQSIVIVQSDPLQKGRQWSQSIDVQVSEKQTQKSYQIELSDTFNVIALDEKVHDLSYIFPNSEGLGYGYFEIDSTSKQNMLFKLPGLTDPTLKCSMYISLWENMLHEKIEPDALLNAFIRSLKTEENPQNISLLLDYLEMIYWKFLTQTKRTQISHDIESILWEKIHSISSAGVKASFFNSYIKMVSTAEGLLHLYKIWTKETELSALNLTARDFTAISFELALRDFPSTDSILNEQYLRLKDPERKERFIFIKEALAKDIEQRNLFFEKIKDEKNREKEPWVADALGYFHHPLRSKESVRFIYPTLMMLEELQQTGDIFFPQQCLEAMFSGHSSIDAVIEINLFLNEHPHFPDNLKNKIIQSSDLVFRSSIIKKE